MSRVLPLTQCTGVSCHCAHVWPRSDALRSSGVQVYKFGLGQSPFPVFEPMVRALREHAAEKDYLNVTGLLQLREAIAAFQNRQFPCLDGTHAATAEGVLVGPGSKELLFLLQLAYYGELLLPQPSWVSYGPQAQLIGRPLSWLRTQQRGAWKVTPEALATYCSKHPNTPRLMVLNYPSNPTGASYSPVELAELAAVCRQYAVLVLSDEIYSLTSYDPAHIGSISQYYPEGTVVLGGASKYLGAGGWRVGFLSFPQELQWLRAGIAAAASETFTSVSAPLQYATVAGFEPSEELDQYLDDSRRVLKLVADYTVDELRRAGATVARPQGGFYVLPNFATTQRYRELVTQRRADGSYVTSDEMVMEILNRTGVACLAGSHFGLPPELLRARMAFVEFDGGAAQRAVRELPREVTAADVDGREFVQRAAPQVAAGLASLHDFLTTSE